MDVQAKENNLIMQKLMDLSLDGAFFNENLLRKYNLFTEDTLDLLFYNDCLDFIYYQEAIDALPFFREIIKQRRTKLDAIRAEKFSPGMAKMMKGQYAPHAILDDIAQYGLILRQRNNYIPIKEVLKELEMETSSYTSVYRLLKKYNIKSLYSQKYIKVESVEILMKAGLKRENSFSKEMQISRATYYRYKKDPSSVLRKVNIIKSLKIETI